MGEAKRKKELGTNNQPDKRDVYTEPGGPIGSTFFVLKDAGTGKAIAIRRYRATLEAFARRKGWRLILKSDLKETENAERNALV